MTERKVSAHDVGAFGENAAAKYLKKAGFRIKERNIRLGHDEIDMIAENRQYILFVEVKTRSADMKNYFRPAAAVDHAKRSHLIEGAFRYLHTCGGRRAKKQPRIDVIEVEVVSDAQGALSVKSLTHIENAVTR